MVRLLGNGALVDDDGIMVARVVYADPKMAEALRLAAERELRRRKGATQLLDDAEEVRSLREKLKLMRQSRDHWRRMSRQADEIIALTLGGEKK